MIAVVVIVLLALIGAGTWFVLRNRPPAPTAEANTSAPQEVADTPSAVPPLTPPEGVAPPPANETYDRQAVLAGSTATMLRSSASPIGITVARIEPGEVFTTYQQDGDWWRVRTASGATGYLAAPSIRLRAPGTETAMDQPDRPAQKTERRPEPRQPRGPRVRKENSEVMAAFCEGSGRGTPECRRFQRSNY